MAKRLMARAPADLARLRGVASTSVLVVLGEADDLPWVEGASYLGRDPIAPSLWLPTTRAPSVSAALLERALVHLPSRGPCAVLLAPSRIVPLSAARPVVHERLAAFLAEAS